MNHLDRRTTDPALLRRRGRCPRAAEQHLEECEECRALYGSLQRVLNVVDSLPVPERGPDYGAEVWRAHRAPACRRGARYLPGAPFRGAGPAAGAALAGLLVRRSWQDAFIRRLARLQPMAAAADPQIGERVLLVAVGDYLERSQMVLIELANANPHGPLDISSRAGTRGRPGERKPPLPADRGAHRQTAAIGVFSTSWIACCWISRTRPRRFRRMNWKICASGWKPKAFCSRFGLWARTSGTRKNRRGAGGTGKSRAEIIRQGQTK